MAVWSAYSFPKRVTAKLLTFVKQYTADTFRIRNILLYTLYMNKACNKKRMDFKKLKYRSSKLCIVFTTFCYKSSLCMEHNIIHMMVNSIMEYTWLGVLLNAYLFIISCVMSNDTMTDCWFEKNISLTLGTVYFGLGHDDDWNLIDLPIQRW